MFTAQTNQSKYLKKTLWVTLELGSGSWKLGKVVGALAKGVCNC